MPPQIMTAVQTELTPTADQVEIITSNPLTKSPSTGDGLTTTDDKKSSVADSSPASSQIPVITASEQKKKPYGGRPLRFQCPNCERRFHAPSHLKRHMLCHTSERPFQCHICNKGFLQAWHLGRHMTTHTGNKPFNCPECPKTFGSRFEMKTHCNYIHRGIKEHECPICKKLFTLRSNLKVHMRKHTGEKPYECHVCSKKFGQRGHLQYHLRKHEGASENTVNNKLGNSEEQEQEIIDVENDVDQQSVSYDSGVESVTSESQPSPAVPQNVSSYSQITSPITRIISPVLRETKSPSEIPLSGRMFDHTNPQELKSFVCVSCNCGFGEISSLHAHVRHSHLRKGIATGHFSCAHCNKSFVEIDSLKAHYEDNHRPQHYIQTTSVISPPLSPSYRKVGEKYSYSKYEAASVEEYEPTLKRSQSQIIYDERRTSSPGNASVSSDTTFDRPSYNLPGFYPQCPSDCNCEFRRSSSKLLPQLALPREQEHNDYVQSRYLTYLEQYHKLLESHVHLMEALKGYRN